MNKNSMGETDTKYSDLASKFIEAMRALPPEAGIQRSEEYLQGFEDGIRDFSNHLDGRLFPQKHE